MSDAELISESSRELAEFTASTPSGKGAFCIVETAGGVASPAPSGKLQVSRDWF